MGRVRCFGSLASVLLTGSFFAAGCQPKWVRIELDAAEAIGSEVRTMRVTVWREGNSPEQDENGDVRLNYTDPRFPIYETFVPGAEGPSGFWMRAEITNTTDLDSDGQHATIHHWVQFQPGGATVRYEFVETCFAEESLCEDDESCDSSGCSYVDEGPYADCRDACIHLEVCGVYDMELRGDCIEACLQDFPAMAARCLRDAACADLEACEIELDPASWECVPDTGTAETVEVNSASYQWLDNPSGPLSKLATCSLLNVTGDGLLEVFSETGTIRQELFIDGIPAGYRGPP